MMASCAGSRQLDAGGVDVVAFERRLDQHGRCARVADGQHRGDKGVGRGNDLVPGADAMAFKMSTSASSRCRSRRSA